MRYFFNLCEADTCTIDTDGAEYADEAAASARGRLDIWRMIGIEVAESGEVRLARRIDITDAGGAIIGSLPFADVVAIIR